MSSTAGGVSSPARAWLRLGVTTLLAWGTLHLLFRPGSGSVMDLVDLPFHEAGHVFLSPFGSTLHILGGTLGQLAVPTLLAWYFLARRRDPFAAAACLWWLGQSLVNVSVYMADARDLSLPLVGGGEHDWNELFFRFGLLTEPSVRAVSGATRAAGAVIALAGLGWAGTFLLPGPLRVRMHAALRRRAPALRRLLDD